MTAAVAIIVATLNAAETIDAALDSLARAVEAAAPYTAEVVVIDGGSHDVTLARVAQRPGVRSMLQQTPGLAAARNEAVAATTAPLLAFCDADDAWTPDALRVRLAALAQTPTAWGVTGRVRFVERMLAGEGQPVRRRAGSEHPGYTPGAMLVRRSAYEQVGPFDASLRIGADADWILRAEQLLGPIVALESIVLEKGLRAGSLSTDALAYRSEMLVIARRFLAGRRPQRRR
jgi:glycosyltransferase involved in cell wall biosynthesis